MIPNDRVFGCSVKNFERTCVLMPFLHRSVLEGLGLTELSKGFPYRAGSAHGLTLIETRMGECFAGDAVLLLQDSPCRQIVFIGSCGCLPSSGLGVGSLVLVGKSYDIGSFSQILTGRPPVGGPVPTADLLREELADRKLPTVTAASVNSILLEPTLIDRFQALEVDVVDLESAAVIQAATHIGRPILAVLYVTDRIGIDNPYEMPQQSSEKVFDAQRNAVDVIRSLV